MLSISDTAATTADIASWPAARLLPRDI